ncbi:MAG TPA: DNA methyltransferase [Ktedonobacteraceae bacterium]|jgi:hypothetical protein
MTTSITTGSRTHRQKIQQHVQNFRFKALFVEELGWDILKASPLPIVIDGSTHLLRPLVEKRGVQVFVCDPDVRGQIPAERVMRKIELEVTRLAAYEQFMIYVDAAGEHQVWQWVKREPGKRATVRINRYHKGQSGELLAQKLERLAIRLEEEEHLHLADVVGRVATAFDVERVTRTFYERFKLEHTAFLGLIEGLQEQADREWYASLMLNRLMFVYFIQRKGFLDTKGSGKLDGDPNYLTNRLKRVQQEHGSRQFHTFYRYFLRKLFHEGLGQPRHTPGLETLLGKVPYLNGGLFDVHVLEQANPEINIPDQAFARLFAFFDQFDWHLDDRPLHNDREINPDVLGSIFEKYTNQKQMGAYYTREDITEYISKTTLLPFLLDAAQQRCQAAFGPDGPVWVLLRENPDAYIYDAVKKGCELPLPAQIATGLQDVARRGTWNRPAPEEYALPTETWREVVARRARYQEVHTRLVARQITSVNELITCNLDIRHFTQDVIAYCTSPDLLQALYDSIAQVSVLDPTCGSGAFLFAALNILEELYAACLERMQDLVEEQTTLAAPPSAEQQDSQAAIQHFCAVLEQVGKQSNRAYFIYKSIIINNLYGVDIMKEATETCKLRLFLKLASQVETFSDIQPLPDIDFNIRAGNTLVGFASHRETLRAIEGRTVGQGGSQGEVAIQNQLVFDDRLAHFAQQARMVEDTFEHFRELQTQPVLDTADMANSKQRLRQQLGHLRTELDSYLASQYGIERRDMPDLAEYDARFARWRQSHQPFHWWVEFYRIMRGGGFDVIIGNPPYVEYEQVTKIYTVLNYITLSCGNLYALIVERSAFLGRDGSRFGMIVPASASCTDGYIPLQKLLLAQSALHISSYSDQRGKLFDIPHPRLCVITYHKSASSQKVFSTSYIKLGRELRDCLFERLEYIDVTDLVQPGRIPRYGSDIERRIHAKLLKQTQTIRDFSAKTGKHNVYYTRKLSWFVQVTTFIPRIVTERGEARNPSELKILHFASPAHADCAFVVLNSNLFYWFFTGGSDCRNLNMREVLGVPLSMNNIADPLEKSLRELSVKLTESLQNHAEHRTMSFKGIGALTIQCLFPGRSRYIIDEIDRILASHYGFTDQELDFIINYDIKYRMGCDQGSEKV